jgi:RNA polymerase sigma-70 factor (ECF subfamily)
VDADEVRRLVEVARGGDEEAWERLYGHVYPRLRAYMFRRVGAEAVEDVVNETMARAVAGIGRFRWEPAGFDAWVFGIARRVAADHHRQAGRFRRAMRAADPTAGVAPEPGEALELGQDHAQIRA